MERASNQTIYSLSPPHGKITADDHGGYIVITVWIMVSLMSLTVLARLLTRIFPVGVYGWDDIAIALGMLIAIFQSITVHFAVTNGMGRHYSSLNARDFALYSKFNYASQILYTMTLYSAKLSVLLFISRLTPSREMRRISWVAVGIVTAWGMSFTIALALQCSGPNHWDFSQQGNCVDRSTLYCLFGTLDIITDIAIMALPAFIVWNVQITRHQRWTVIGVFCSRLAVCISTGFVLGTLRPYLDFTDQPWNAVTPQIWVQVTQALSLTTACIPCLRPFLASLESGFLDSTMRSQANKTYGSSGGSAANGSGVGGSRGIGRNPTSEEGYQLDSLERGEGKPRMIVLKPDSSLFMSRMASTSIPKTAKRAKAAFFTLQSRNETYSDGGNAHSSRSDDRRNVQVFRHGNPYRSRPHGSSGGESMRPLKDPADIGFQTPVEGHNAEEYQAYNQETRQPSGVKKNILKRARDSLESCREGNSRTHAWES